jgi:hypothetical protein
MKLNHEILAYLEEVGATELYNDSIVKEFMTSILKVYYLKKKPHVASVEKLKRNLKINKMILSETNKDLINNNVSSIISFLNHCDKENGKAITKEFCKNLTNSRNLLNEDIVNFVSLIEKYKLHDISRHHFISIAPNLMTIDSQKVNITMQSIPDENF